MAIERGVDDIDIDELGIEDNSKEILVGSASEEDLMFDDVEDGDEVILDDGTMVFGMDDMADDMEGDDNPDNASIYLKIQANRIRGDKAKAKGNYRDAIEIYLKWR